MRGAGHIVFSLGSNIVQTAWNSGVSLPAFRECLTPSSSYFPTPRHSLLPQHFPQAHSLLSSGHHSECQRSDDNGGDATRFTIPCLRLQALGLDIGLDEVRFGGFWASASFTHFSLILILLAVIVQELLAVTDLITDVDANEHHPLSR